MNLQPLAQHPEHLNPHDVVTYSRCPHEMELTRARRQSVITGTACTACTPVNALPEHRSPLFDPPSGCVVVNEGPLDVGASDRLIYVDSGETGIPLLFAPDQVQLDDRLRAHGTTLFDDELGFSGRPDLVVRRSDGTIFPVEYKSTHLFSDYHDPLHHLHGRRFDVVQAIAECRLVHTSLGVRPRFGVVWYGDQAGEGRHEGWVTVPYGDSEERWLRAAMVQIRSDRVRAPVPAERTCSTCEPNRDGDCRFAAVRYSANPPRSF